MNQNIQSRTKAAGTTKDGRAENTYDLEDFRISGFELPFEIDGSKEINKFIKGGVLKTIENTKMRERYAKLITSKRVTKLVNLGFWFVFCAKFPGCVEMDDPERFLQALR